MDDERKKRLAALAELARNSVKRNAEGELEVENQGKNVDQDVMDDILARKKARIRAILEKQRSGEDFKKVLADREKYSEVPFEGMSDEEREAWAEENYRKERRKRGLE